MCEIRLENGVHHHGNIGYVLFQCQACVLLQCRRCMDGCALYLVESLTGIDRHTTNFVFCFFFLRRAIWTRQVLAFVSVPTVAFNSFAVNPLWFRYVFPFHRTLLCNVEHTPRNYMFGLFWVVFWSKSVIVLLYLDFCFCTTTNAHYVLSLDGRLCTWYPTWFWCCPKASSVWPVVSCVTCGWRTGTRKERASATLRFHWSCPWCLATLW